MTAVDTRSTVVVVATNDVSEYVNTHNFEVNPTILEKTGYGTDWAGNRGGLKKATFSIGGVYDDGATSPPATLRAAYGTTVAVEYGPEGDATGNPKLTFNAVVGKYNESGKVDDQVMWACDLTVDGAVTEGTYA